MTKSRVLCAPLFGAIFVPLALFGGQILHAQERPATAQEPVPEIAAFSYLARTPAQGAAGAPLLRRPMLNRERDDISAQSYPPQLLTDPGQRDYDTELLVSLDAAGRPIACRAARMDVIEDRVRRSEDIPAQLADQACALAMETLGYHHALDRSGNSVAAEISVGISFRWQRPALSPAPGPPASWIPSVEGWPPPYFYAQQYQGIPLVRPNGRDFVTDDRDRPRRANVGLLFTTDAVGTVTSCRVTQPSGVEAYDAASCPAMASVHQRFALRDFPLQLQWNRRNVRFGLPVEMHGPQLLAEAVPTAAMAAGIELPTRAVASVELAVSPEGRLQSCEVTRPTFVDALDLASCRLFGSDTRFTQPTDIFGGPAEGRLRMEIDWRRLTARRDGY